MDRIKEAETKRHLDEVFSKMHQDMDVQRQKDINRLDAAVARTFGAAGERKKIEDARAHERQMQQDRFEHETRMAQMQAASQREHLIHQERLRQMELAAHRNIQGRR